MIAGMPASVRVYLCAAPCDLRKSFDGRAPSRLKNGYRLNGPGEIRERDDSGSRECG